MGDSKLTVFVKKDLNFRILLRSPQFTKLRLGVVKFLFVVDK